MSSTKASLHPGFIKAMCGQSDCAVCAMMHEKIFERDWCFEWLRQLKDFEASQELAEKDRQVVLMVKHSDNEPVWTIIDAIQKQSEILAIEMVDKLRQKRFGISETEEQQTTSAIQQFNLDAVPALKGIRLNEKEVSTISDIMMAAKARSEDVAKVKDELISFVKTHILAMLKNLYVKIGEEETELKKCLGQNPAKIITEVSDLPKVSQPGGKSKSIGLERYWFKLLYSGQRADSKAGQQNDLRIVGPVGERPLHVCALSTARFGHVDFEGAGNYVSEGIVEGMMEYINATFTQADGAEKIADEFSAGWREATAQYGKDYCAAVGSLEVDWDRDRHAHDSGILPPFWRQINKWKKAHLQQRGLGSTPLRFAKILVTTGIYEGETILFPLIAGKHEKALYQLLRRDKTPRFLQLPVKGLFFLPMHRRCLTSFSVFKGWDHYIKVRYRDVNVEASSRRSYFGLNALFFAASQGDVSTFDLVFFEIERELLRDNLLLCLFEEWPSEAPLRGEAREFFKGHLQVGKRIMDELYNAGWTETARKGLLRRALVDVQDQYGNTLLHVAAWNDQPAMYDRIVTLGANQRINNRDGLTPFTLTARFGIWNMFNHIWENHLTQTVWRFGNVERRASDHTSFDWKGMKTFVTRAEVDRCLTALMEIYYCEHSRCISPSLRDTYDKQDAGNTTGDSLRYKQLLVEQKVREWCEGEVRKRLRSRIEMWLHWHESESLSDRDNVGAVPRVADKKDSKDQYFDEREEDAELRSAIRMITLFRPKDWYKHTKDKLEEVILHKWSEGYHFVHLGQSLIPYLVILVVFGFMWLNRQLHILQHNLWWAEPEITASINSLPNQTILRNPVVADIPELARLTNATRTGTMLFENGKIDADLFGVESTCGWQAIRDSTSGRLQAVLVIYAVISLLRQAFSQRRVRPSDWDENEDMTITSEETINFIYLNLESLVHIVICGLFVSIGVARVSAGDECDVYFVRMEKNSTSIAALLLFFNLITVCKPYEGIGLLLLTTYNFLISDVFYFLVMYSVLLAGFLLSIQTLHNANRVYLAWLDATQHIFPQVQAVTGGAAYLVNSNTPDGAKQLLDTHTAMNGCRNMKWNNYDTAMALLEISFGDGLSDALEQARRSDYECAGFRPDQLIAYILVLWVFLTNVLILNMLIAMMNNTFDLQKKGVHAVWLLDVSYRIMRYERIFPELIDRMQMPHPRYSFWRRKFWQQLFLDVCLVIYCLPELHIWGFSHAVYVWGVKKLRSCTSSEVQINTEINVEKGEFKYPEAVNALVKKVDKQIYKAKLFSENDARKRAKAELVDELTSDSRCIDGVKMLLRQMKWRNTKENLTAVSNLPDVVNEVFAWTRLVLSAPSPAPAATQPATEGSVVTNQKLSCQTSSQLEHPLHDRMLMPLPQLAHASLVLPKPIDVSPAQHLAHYCPAEDGPATNGPASPPAYSTFVLPQEIAGNYTPSCNQQQPAPVALPENSQQGTLNSHDQHQWPSDSEDFPLQALLVISLICRLDMLQQNFRESCTVLSLRTLATKDAASVRVDDSEEEG